MSRKRGVQKERSSKKRKVPKAWKSLKDKSLKCICEITDGTSNGCNEPGPGIVEESFEHICSEKKRQLVNAGSSLRGSARILQSDLQYQKQKFSQRGSETADYAATGEELKFHKSNRELSRLNPYHNPIRDGADQITGSAAAHKAVENSEKTSAVNIWTREQELSLHKAYFNQKPSQSFWRDVAKQVPGKTANECFHKFYSAHPTPPVQQPHARRCDLISPIKKFRKMLSPSRLILQTKNRRCTDKSWLNESRKMIRHMLRKQQNKDKGYEEDAFVALEQESRADGLNVARNHIIVSAEEDPFTNHSSTDECHSYNISSNTLLNHKGGVLLDGSHTHSLKEPFSKLAHATLVQDYSPEVLKKSKDMRHFDRYVNILICRHRATKKEKQIGKNVETNITTLSCKNENLDLISAKAAVIAGARDILKNKGLKEKEIQCFDEVSDEDMDQDSHVDDDDI